MSVAMGSEAFFQRCRLLEWTGAHSLSCRLGSEPHPRRLQCEWRRCHQGLAARRLQKIIFVCHVGSANCRRKHCQNKRIDDPHPFSSNRSKTWSGDHFPLGAINRVTTRATMTHKGRLPFSSLSDTVTRENSKKTGGRLSCAEIQNLALLQLQGVRTFGDLFCTVLRKETQKNGSVSSQICGD